MNNLCRLYECPQCGDVWKVEPYKHIDTENDEVYPDMLCSACGRSVREKTKDGLPCYTEIDEEDAYYDAAYFAWLHGEIDDEGYAIDSEYDNWD